MANPTTGGGSRQQKPRAASPGVPVEHYLRLLLHRKWLILGLFVLTTAGVIFYAQRLPNVYTSAAVLMVDPQKVPESYVKSTVTGDIRNRLGILKQQILSATRLQRIIDQLNLYPVERKTLAREDVIAKMQREISVAPLSDFGGSDLQAFQIAYSGKDPRLVSQVTNKLAELFIDENMKSREQQATGTTEFFENQLTETRKALEEQEGKIRAFKLKHIGEMPEQQTMDLQILSQLQAQLQGEGEALRRAEDQKAVLETMGGQAPPPRVVDLDGTTPPPAIPGGQKSGPAKAATAQLSANRAKLAQMLTHYKDTWPDVVKLKAEIQKEEAAAAAAQANAPTPAVVKEPEQAQPVRTEAAPTQAAASHSNPVLKSRIDALDAEIQRHKDEQQRLSKQVAVYRSKLEAIPVRDQEIVSLSRDYEMSKVHYSQLLDRQMSAETASQLEVRQKGEKFEVLDPAMPAEKPSSPKRMMYYMGGAIGGLVLGLLAALATELMGMSITDSQDVMEASSVGVLGVIPIILTQADQVTRRRRWIMAGASATFAGLIIGAILFLKLHNQV